MIGDGGKIKMSDILQRINKIFRIIFENENLVISEETCADDINEWDSLQHINLIAMLEQEFGIEFDIDEIISMENVGDMVKVISSRCKFE